SEVITKAVEVIAEVVATAKVKTAKTEIVKVTIAEVATVEETVESIAET
ncbi:10355_t:CDS:2, partial [Scutellospora calospora]